MISDSDIHLPSCHHCNDDLFPSILWVWPAHAVVWVCLNCHATMVIGTDEQPERREMVALAGLGVWVASQTAEA